MTHFFDLDPPAMEALLADLGMARFRAKQLRQWVYQRGVTDPDAMTDFAKADRAKLAEAIVFHRWRVERDALASDGTRKLLLQAKGEAGDGAPPPRTECVMIPAESRDSGKSRRTACISSQVGCPVGCRFCASGLGGLEADLTTGQVLEQVWWLNRVMQADPPGAGSPPAPDADRGDAVGPPPFGAVSNIVFMGMGEPLSNFAAVLPAIRALAADWAFGISARRITLSTVGLPAQVRRLADQLDLPITLALSLHAPNDALRRRLIPWARRVSIDQLVDACRYYFERTGREITLEYILLREVNDRPEHARELARVARRLRANVNLIRYNEVASLPYQRPATDDVIAFQRIVKQAGVVCHIRASRGRDIAAACGQLRHENA